MIKNEKQYKISKAKRDEFIKSLGLVISSDKDDLIKELMTDSLNSQIKIFDKELIEYEKLKNESPKIISASFDRIPEALIKARIASGLTQSELADKVGVKEQQIQRYESTDYESANFDKLLNIAKSMGIIFEDTRLILKPAELKVEGYDSKFLRNATCKLQSRRSFLTI